MIQNATQAQPSNLTWLSLPQQQMDGYWLAVEPSPAAWNTIQKIQNFVTSEMAKEKIQNWAPYPHRISHVSIFLGFNEKMTAQEKTVVMRRVADKISKMPKFNIDFDLSQAVLDRGPGNYITLKFTSPSIQALNLKVREAVKEAISAGEFDRSHLYTNGTGKDKLDLDIEPHMTVGIIDVNESPAIEWKDKHPDMRAFYNKANTQRFIDLFKEKTSKGELNGLRVSFPVNNIDLLGLNNPKSKVAQKQYTTLATCGLNTESKSLNPYAQYYQHAPAAAQPSSQPAQRAGYTAPALPADSRAKSEELLRQFQGLSISQPMPPLVEIRQKMGEIIFPGVSLKFKLDKDESGQPLINVGFDTFEQAKRVLDQTAMGGKIWNTDGKYWVRLGQKRMMALFGANKGSEVYKAGIATLQRIATPALAPMTAQEATARFKAKLRELTRNPNFDFSTGKKAPGPNNGASITIALWQDSDSEYAIYRHFKDYLESCNNVHFDHENQSGKIVSRADFDETDFQILFGDDVGSKIFKALYNN